MVSSTVTDTIIQLLLIKKKKEEIAERICAGMPSHFGIDTEVTLEMHWI